MKRASRNMWGFGRLVGVLSAAALGLLVTGCEPECVDRYDCENKKGSPGEGQRYACVDSRCVPQDISSPGMDAGSDAGTDAGSDAGTDAGVACADLPHDAKLGTLALETGFVTLESASLPEGISAVTALTSGSSFALYGVNDTNESLYALGTWPDVVASTTPLQPIVAPGDKDSTHFLGGYLTNDGTRLLTGYTRSGAGFPGQVLVYDTAASSATYLSAPGNFTAAGLSGGFLINGLGLQDVTGEAAIYALKTSATPYAGSKLATFPETGVSSSSTAMATNGIAVLGYGKYDPATFTTTNFLRAVAPSVYSTAFSDGTSIALSHDNAKEIYVGADLFGATSFGDGVVLHRGTSYDSKTYTPLTQDVSRIALTVDSSDPKTVAVGALTPVLTANGGTCTNVVLMAPLGADLLVGVKDKNGRRLVRLHKQ